jgi:hypothetical protein
MRHVAITFAVLLILAGQAEARGRAGSHHAYGHAAQGHSTKGQGHHSLNWSINHMFN